MADTVDPLLPLSLLEAVRTVDLPEGDLEAEFVAELRNKRLGLSDTVFAQIKRFTEAVRRRQQQSFDEAQGIARLIGRRPDAEEALELTGLFERQRQRLVGRADDLMAVNRIGQIAMSDQVPEAEAAAGVAVARAVLNLHETITRY